MFQKTLILQLDHKKLPLYDNSPGQFKECFFFYLDYWPGEQGTVSENRSQVSLEGNSYSTCDRRFGCTQKFFDTVERIEVPQEWAMLLKDSPLKNIEVHWATLNMIKDYKFWLRRQ